MSEEIAHILPIPEQKIDRYGVGQVDLDRLRAREIAGPIFDAGFTKVALAKMVKQPGNLNRAHTHWFHLVIQGKMQFRLGRDTVIAEAGDLVRIPAGTTTQKSSLGPVIWIYAEIEDIPMWAPLKTLGPSMRKYESTDLMYILVKKITDAVRSQDVYSIRCAYESSEMLVTLLRRELGQTDGELPTGRVNKLIRLLDEIREDPRADWNRSTMAKQVNMSERNLSRIFQRTFEMPPARMVTSIRMDLAIRFLLSTDMSLADIASAVGYDSPFSFSRLFRKHAGVSPGKYRSLAEADRQSLPAKGTEEAGPRMDTNRRE